jgi:hypothetical protein
LGRRWGRRRCRGDHVEHGRRGLRVDDGIVGENGAAQGANTFELFGGAAIEALGLRLEPEEELAVVGLAVEAAEALVESKVTVLRDGNLDVLNDFGIEEAERASVGVEGLIEGCGVEAICQTGATHEVLLGEGETLKGEKLLGIGGLVIGDEIGAEVGDGLEVLEADDGIGAGDEGMLAGAHAPSSNMSASGWTGGWR